MAMPPAVRGFGGCAGRVRKGGLVACIFGPVSLRADLVSIGPLRAGGGLRMRSAWCCGGSFQVLCRSLCLALFPFVLAAFPAWCLFVSVWLADVDGVEPVRPQRLCRSGVVVLAAAQGYQGPS